MCVPSLNTDIVIVVFAIFALLRGRHCCGCRPKGLGARVGAIDASLAVGRVVEAVGGGLFGLGWDVNEHVGLAPPMANINTNTTAALAPE